MSNRDRHAVLVLGAIVLAAKLPTLATPYYWDETLWIGFAHTLAGLPLWHVLPGCHPPTLFGGRPPGLYLPMAALFKATGPSIWLSHFVIAGFAALGVAFTYRLGALLYGRAAGVFAALFLFLNPMYFAQAGMFVTDLPVAATGVASVYWALRRRYAPYLVCAVALALLKETALAIVFAVSAYVLVREWRRGVAHAVGTAAVWGLPAVLMGLYYTAQKLTSGSFFVHYAEPFDWLQPGALGQARTITRWLFLEQSRWICSALIIAHLAIHPAARRRPELLLFGLIVVCSAYAFSVLYFLPRYLLPVMPYLSVLAAAALVALFPAPAVHLTAGAGLVLLLALRLPGTARPGNREWDLGYLAAVRTYAATARYLERDHAGARILAAWPLYVCLRRPELGYVGTALQTFHPSAVGPPDAPRVDVDVVVDCSLGNTPPGLLPAYAARRDLSAVEHIAVDGFRCDVYSAPVGAAAHRELADLDAASPARATAATYSAHQSL